jgi:hypothetical protein
MKNYKIVCDQRSEDDEVHKILAVNKKWKEICSDLSGGLLEEPDLLEKIVTGKRLCDYI